QARTGGPVLGDVRRTIRAFWQPDRFRATTEVTLVRPDAGFDLAIDGRIARQQRQVAMRGGARRDFDQPPILELLERSKKVGLEPVAEGRQGSRIPMVIEDREGLELLIAGVRKTLDVCGGPRGALLGVRDEVLDNQRIAELLGEDGRDTHRNPVVDPLIGEVMERGPQRNIGLGNRLMDPLLAVWPHAGLSCVWQMTVQYECERAVGVCHVSLLTSRWARNHHLSWTGRRARLTGAMAADCNICRRLVNPLLQVQDATRPGTGRLPVFLCGNARCRIRIVQRIAPLRCELLGNAAVCCC